MLVRVRNLRRNRHGTFQFRLTIPKEHRSKVQGKAEKFWSLGTKSEAEALRKLPQARAAAEAFLASLRNEIVLSPPEAQRLAERWLAVALSRDEEERRRADFPDDPAGTDPVTVGHDVAADNLLERLAEGDLSGVEIDVDEILNLEGLAIPADSASWKRLGRAIAGAKIRLLRIQHERAQGLWSSRRAEPGSNGHNGRASLPHTAPTLRQAHEAWKAVKPRSETALSDWKSAVEGFVAMFGDLPITAIEKRMVAAYRDALLTDPKKARKPGTVKKLVGALSTILQKQVDDGAAQFNPAKGVKVDKPKNAPKAREDFSIEELRRLFGGPIFSEGVRPVPMGGEAAYWVFVLGLYTGARLDEICQLEISDVVAQDGVRFFSFHDFENGKKLKNANSRRIVPIHPDVTALGFDGYLKSIPQNGALFPDLRPLGRKRPSQRFSKWANRVIDDAGLDDRRLTFHSLRHTFKTAARRAELHDDIHDRLTGHKQGNVGRSYGKAELLTLSRAMRRIAYPGLAIPKWRPGNKVARYERTSRRDRVGLSINPPS